MHISIDIGLFLIFVCVSDVSCILFMLRPLIPVLRFLHIGRSTTLSDEIIKEVREDIFNKSNHYRKIHGLSDFVMSDTLDSVAQDSATYLAKYNKMKVKNGSEIDYIEFGYQITSFNHVGEVLVDWWYMEITDFNKSDDDFSKSMNLKTISLTQLFWKKSKEIGVGVARDRYDNVYHIVIVLRPGGNVIGEFAENEPNFTPEQLKEQIDKKKLLFTTLGIDKIEDIYRYETKQEYPDLPSWTTTLHKNPK